MLRNLFIAGCLLLAGENLLAADSLFLYSPNKQIQVAISWGNGLRYVVRCNGQEIIHPSVIDMTINGQPALSEKIRIRSKQYLSVNDSILSPVPEKRRKITDHYNELRLQLATPYQVYFRAYDDGIAYRIATQFKDSVIVENETASIAVGKNRSCLLPLVTPRTDVDHFHTSFEELYQWKLTDSISADQLAYTPMLVGSGKEIKIAITESDLEDYPGMFISGDGAGNLIGRFAGYPLQYKMSEGEFSQEQVAARADYIARTKGTRNFPWRVLMIAAEDKQLPGSDMVYRLAQPSRIADTKWIKPGQCTDEWIIGINLYNVPFKAGINTATYKYYVDFAKRFGIERIMLDAGWSSYTDLLSITPSMNMDSLVAYAKEQGVKLGMWTLCSTLDRQLEPALEQFNKWGVDFIMTDFMDRDDQPMVRFYERIAKACAEHHIMIMFHGAYPPKGFNRTWPNNLTREGVLGSEFNIWSDKPNPEHDLTLPFTRMLAGPMDYEPGLLDNATKEQFRPIGKKVMSQGTRCHQLAMFVVYDSPFQVFSGNPSQAEQEPAFMQLLGSIPTVWDDTKILEAAVGDYIITARKSGDDWFIGGMTDWTPRSFTLSLDFLDEGEYEVLQCSDGINADNYPSDYIITHTTTTKQLPLEINMAPGGGFVIKLTKRKK